MVIDIHQHPLFFSEVCDTPQKLRERVQHQAYYHMGVQDARRVIEQNRINGVDKAVLLAHDFSASGGDAIANSEMALLKEKYPEAFWCFAAVDPGREDAEEQVEEAFTRYQLSGLTLHPPRQKISPADDRVLRLCEICARHDKPVLFHAGLSWQPGAIMEYGMPTLFEPIVAQFPRLRVCLSHFAYPWVAETAALMAKYPNLYADTSALFFDSTEEFFSFLFGRMIDFTWLDRGIRHQVLFGTNNTRWSVKRSVQAMKHLPLRPETLSCILGENALEFIGEEEANWLD